MSPLPHPCIKCHKISHVSPCTFSGPCPWLWIRLCQQDIWKLKLMQIKKSTQKTNDFAILQLLVQYQLWAGAVTINLFLVSPI